MRPVNANRMYLLSKACGQYIGSHNLPDYFYATSETGCFLIDFFTPYNPPIVRVVSFFLIFPCVEFLNSAKETVNPHRIVKIPGDLNFPGLSPCMKQFKSPVISSNESLGL